MLKFVVIFTLSILAVANAVGEKEHCAGCINTLEGTRLKDAENELTHSLLKLAAGTGPTYKLGKINSASSQVVSGILYRINAELIEGENKKKTCDISIHSQPWLENGIEITFECPGEEKVVKKHSA